MLCNCYLKHVLKVPMRQLFKRMLCEEGTIQLSPEKYIGYRKRAGRIDKPGVLFCSGFLSNLNGTKAVFLDEYCQRNDISCVRFDYVGHQFSSGTMNDFSIREWKQNALEVLDRVTEGPQIVVGSSMGAWISFLVALERGERVHSVLSISNAADILIPRWELANIRTVAMLGFYWCRLKLQGLLGFEETGKDDVSDEGHSQQHRVPTGAPPLSAIFSARDDSIFSQETIDIRCPVRLLHARNDSVVPYTNSVRIGECLVSDDVQIEIVEDADHRFSSPENLEMLSQVLDELLTKRCS